MLLCQDVIFLSFFFLYVMEDFSFHDGKLQFFWIILFIITSLHLEHGCMNNLQMAHIQMLLEGKRGKCIRLNFKKKKKPTIFRKKWLKMIASPERKAHYAGLNVWLETFCGAFLQVLTFRSKDI